MILRKSISLIGMMASGKTVFGMFVAKKLGVRFIDTDHEIERRTKKKIFKIFEEDGEGNFRKIEEKIVCDIINKANFPIVIAMGGGAFMNDNIRNLALQNTNVVWLKVNFEIMIDRLESATHKRPLLSDIEDKGEYVKNLCKERDPVYNLAPYKINNSNNELKVGYQELFNILK